MKALHVYYNNTIDAKIASSVIYEFFYKYRKDVDIYKFHLVKEDEHISFSDTKNNDVIVIIDDGMCENTNFDMDDHENYWIMNNIVKTKNEVKIPYAKHSLTYSAYMYFKNKHMFLQNENGGTPESILLIDDYINGKIDIDWDFIYGINSYSFSAKNFFKNMFNGSDVADIFKYSPATAHMEHQFIVKMQKVGKSVYNTFKKSEYMIQNKNRGFEFFIIDNLNTKCYKCYAINCLDVNAIDDKIMDNYAIVCTFNMLANREWGYTFVTNTTGVDVKTLTSIIVNDEKWYYDKAFVLSGSTSNESTFYTNNCIFDKGNKITIRKGLLSKKIKVYYTL